jgi:hypothetical protein
MDFSGEHYVPTPRTENLSFVFSSLTLDNRTGVAEFGFSGDNQVFSFLMSGQRLLDPNNRFAYSYGSDEQITISGDYNDSSYRYYINDVLVVDGSAKQGFATEKFFVKTQDCQLSLGLEMFCPIINYSVEVDDYFIAGRTLNGRIVNSSAIGFKILSSELVQGDGVSNNAFTGIVTGDMPALSTLEFELHDVSEILYDSEASSTLSLVTTFGAVSHDIMAFRVSGYFNDVLNFSIAEEGIDTIEPSFLGSGDATGFSWLADARQKIAYNLEYSVQGTNEEYGEGMVELPKPLYFSLENVSPANQELYTGTYVASWLTYDKNLAYCTGSDHSCSNSIYASKEACETNGATWQSDLEICRGEIPGSGSYSGQAPLVEFLSYSRVTGVEFNSQNIFSQGTPDKISMLFSGHEGELGAGAAGYFLTEPFQFTFNIDSNSPHPRTYNYVCSDPQYTSEDECELYNNETWTTSDTNWRRITGFEMTDFGTGYTKAPAVFAATGMMVQDGTVAGGFREEGVVIDTPYAYDLPWSYGALYTFERFVPESRLKEQAAYLTGVPYFVETGNSIYAFSGVLITNPGSGYEPDVYKPRLRITRDSEDLFGPDRGFCTDTSYTTQASCENYGEIWTAILGDDLSGEFLFNTKGTLYDFTETWNLKTGVYLTGLSDLVDFREENFIQNEKYVNSGIVSSYDTSFYACVEFDNLDIDEPIFAKLVVTGKDDVREEFLISGVNSYSTETGMAYVKAYILYSEGVGAYNTTYFGG